MLTVLRFREILSFVPAEIEPFKPESGAREVEIVPPDGAILLYSRTDVARDEPPLERAAEPEDDLELEGGE